MPLFTYRAYDRDGREVDGLLEVNDLADARAKLRAMGIMPFQLEPSTGLNPLSRVYRHRLSLAEQARLARQLAALLKGGVPLARAFAGLETQEAWIGRRLTLSVIREGIEGGKDLTVVLSSLGEIFDPWSLSVLKVGEATGKLDLAFAELASHLSRGMEYRRRLYAALAYPTIMMLVAVGVLVFLLTYLLPMIQGMFADMQGKLPLITRFLIGLGTGLREYGVFIVIGVLGLLAFGRSLWNRPELRRRLEVAAEGVPLAGTFLLTVRHEAWSRNLAMMLRCGVPLLESIRVSRACSSSLTQKDRLELVEHALEKGKALSQALQAAGGFPAMMLQMIEAGEASGDLAGMLGLVAGEYEADSLNTIEILLNLLEPLLILGMGLIVGGIMIGVLLPIYEMNRLM
ncbi:MAG: type II secretion system F family protein [Candidatus Ozemobacteraceae bacterium]